MSSQRVQDGYKTKGSSASIFSPQEYSGSNTLQSYDQGVYINDINVLIGSAVTKLRPNNDFLKIKNGEPVQITAGVFDDNESPASFGSSGKFSINFFSSNHPQGGKGSALAVAPSHYLLDNDFGQPDFYQDGSDYFDKLTAINPLWIITTDPAILPYYLSADMVNSSEMISTDGVIDPFSVRKEAERSFTEVPFRYKGTRGDLVNDNVYRRSALIVDEVPSVFSRIRIDSSGIGPLYSTDPFLDAGDEFGLDDLGGATDIGPVNSEGYVLPEESRVSPYKETDDNELTALLISNQSDTAMIETVRSLTGSNNFPSHDYLSRDHISPVHGFVYDNSVIGMDSLAFGGLLR